MPTIGVNARLALELITRNLFGCVRGAPAGTVWTDSDFAISAADALLQMMFRHQVPLDIAVSLAQIALRELGCTSAMTVGYHSGAPTGAGPFLRLTAADSTQTTVTITAAIEAR